MAGNSKLTRPIPDEPETVAGGATYYEATTTAQRFNTYPGLWTLDLTDTDPAAVLALVNPRPVEVLRLTNPGTPFGVDRYTRISFRFPSAPYLAYTHAYPQGDNSRRALVLTAAGFTEFPWLNGQTFACNVGFSGRGSIEGLNIPVGSVRGRQLAAITGFPGGYLGVPFARVHKGDPQGAYTLTWDRPVTDGGEEIRVDYYNVYQRSGTGWAFVGSTIEPEITIRDLVADLDRGLQIHEVPLDENLKDAAIDGTYAANNYTLGPLGDAEIDALPRVPDQNFSPYPQCSAFFAQRQVYAGSRREPETFHMSKTAQFYNFSYSQPRQDDDAIQRQIASGIAQEIRHMVPLKDLLVFTSKGEYVIGAQDSGAITPQTIIASPQSFHGASHVPPVRARDKIVVVERGGKRINDFRYEEEAETYTGQELTVLATHLFDGQRIVDMAYHEGNTSLLFVITDAGRCLVQTKDDALELSGWAEWRTEGEFHSVSVLRTADNTSAVFFGIERDGIHTIERITFDAVDVRNAWTDSGKLVHDEAPIDGRIDADGVISYGQGTGVATPGAKFFITGLRERVSGAAVSVRSTCEDVPITVKADGTLSLPTTRDWVPGPVKIWTAQNTVTGLHHLEGQEVRLGGDGKDFGTRTVVDGQVSLEDYEYARELNAGLEYGMVVQTLPLSTFDQEEPRIYASTRRVNRVVVDTQNFNGGFVAQADREVTKGVQFREIKPREGQSRPVELPGEFSYDKTLVFSHSDASDFSLRRFSAWISVGNG